MVSDTVTFKSAQKISGVKIVFKDGKVSDHKFAPKLYELEILTDKI